jgi:hypothetical protein
MGASYSVDENGCWIWTGNRSKSHGYTPYRTIYEFVNNEVLDSSIALHHTCFNRDCVNPSHLEKLTHSEHMILHWELKTDEDKKESLDRVHKKRTHCPQGHEYSKENTKIRVHSEDGHEYQECKTCHRDRERDRREAVVSVG